MSQWEGWGGVGRGRGSHGEGGGGGRVGRGGRGVVRGVGPSPVRGCRRANEIAANLREFTL